MALLSKTEVKACEYKLEIEVSAVDFDAAVAKVFAKKSKTIQVPGWRKGKAPRKIIENMYGKGVFYEDAINEIAPEAIEAAVKEAGLEQVAPGKDFDVTEIGEDGLKFSVVITTKPDVAIGEYKGLSAARPDETASADDVNKEIDTMRERNSRMVEVSRKSKKGDTATFDFEGFVDDVAFEGGKAENYELELGSNQFIPGFEEQMIGKGVGDEFDVNVKFPEEYHAENLKGKDAIFKIKLHGLKTKELPALDDEFAKDVSTFDTLEELKADTKKNIEERLKKTADNAVDKELTDKLKDILTVELPDAMIDVRVNQNMQNFAQRLQMQGMNMDDYMKHTGMTAEKMMEEFRPMAIDEVKLRLALEKIAELEKIEISADEINAEYEHLAEAYKTDVEKIKAAIDEDEVKSDMVVGKAMELVRENAKIGAVKAPAAKKPATAAKPVAAKSTAAKKPAATTAKKPAASAAKKPTAKSTAAKTKTAEKKSD